MTVTRGESGAAAWQAAQARIQSELGWLRCRWLSELELRSLERGVVSLEASSQEVKALAHEQSEVLKAALAAALGRPVKLKLVVRRGAKARAKKSRPVGEEVILEPERVSGTHKLSGFITGADGALPLMFANEAVQHPGQWHPLVYYGDSGSGKTHLAQGIINATRRRGLATKVVYASADRFARQYTLTMRKRQNDRFRERYRSARLLVLEDLQDIAGKTGTERELCFTLDHLQLVGAQVVVTCERHPKQIPMDSGLQGRLLGGQVVPLRTPGPATRREIVKAHCAAHQLLLGDGVVEFLSEGVDLNARELLNALTRLGAHQRLIDARLDLNTVREILADLLREKVRPANLENVALYVAEKLGTTVEDLRSRSRKPSVVRARQFAMALTRELTGLTLREVGAFYGGRSCASVHFAQGRGPELQAEDPTLRSAWSEATRRFQRHEGASRS